MTVQRASFTKTEREYVKGIVSNLSLQRLSDREIVQWLHDEKHIDIDKTTVTKIRNRAEKDAANWYTSLRESGEKYISVYKQRLDSLLSYQKKIHEIINQCGKSPEIVLKSISELHRIEMSLHTLFKEIPGDVQIEGPVKKEEAEKLKTFDEWFGSSISSYRIGNETDEDNGKYYRNLQKKYNEYVEDWKWHHGFKDGPDPCKSGVWTIDERPPSLVTLPDRDENVESEAWAEEDKQEQKHILTISNGITNTKTEEQPIIERESESEEKSIFVSSEEPNYEHTNTNNNTNVNTIPKDTIDIDVLGCWPKPFDVVPWVQCNYGNTGCNKWFKTQQIRSKHIAKYHT